MIRCGPDEIENETDMKVADSLTTWRSQRAREAICRKSAQTFHLPLVKYEDEYSLCDCKSLSLYFGRKLRNWILEENSWVWKIWTEEEWEVEVKIWTTLTYHKVEWGYRSESDKIMLRKISKVVMYKCVYDDTWREGKEKLQWDAKCCGMQTHKCSCGHKLFGLFSTYIHLL